MYIVVVDSSLRKLFFLSVSVYEAQKLINYVSRIHSLPRPSPSY